MLDDTRRAKDVVHVALPCVNLFSQLADGDDSVAGVP